MLITVTDQQAVNDQNGAEYHYGFALFLCAVVEERDEKMNIEINGVTLQADFMDADFMEIFEPALYEVRDRANKCKTQKTGMVAGAFKELNSCIETFFDTVWGGSTSERIFNGSKNVLEHIEALAQVETAARAERKQFNDISNKYTQRQKSTGFQSMQGHQKSQKPRSNRT